MLGLRLYSRLLAIMILALPLAVVVTRNHDRQMERYRQMSCDGLIAALQGRHIGAGMSVFAAAIIIAGCYAAVELLGFALEKLARLRTG